MCRPAVSNPRSRVPPIPAAGKRPDVPEVVRLPPSRPGPQFIDGCARTDAPFLRNGAPSRKILCCRAGYDSPAHSECPCLPGNAIRIRLEAAARPPPLAQQPFANDRTPSSAGRRCRLLVGRCARWTSIRPFVKPDLLPSTGSDRASGGMEAQSCCGSRR